MNYHLFINGVQEGPMDEEELRRRINAGEASVDDQCWTAGWAEWRLIGDWLEEGKEKKKTSFPDLEFTHILEESPENAKNSNGIVMPDTGEAHTTAKSPRPTKQPIEVVQPDMGSKRASEGRPKMPVENKDGLAASTSSDWRIFPQKRSEPLPLNRSTEEDQRAAREKIPSVGINDSGFGCLFAFIGFLVAWFPMIAMAPSFGADGIGFTLLIGAVLFVATIVLGFFLLSLSRKEQYETTLRQIIEKRVHSQRANFTEEESNLERAAALDTVTCRRILVEDIPKSLSTVKNVVALSEKMTTRAELLFNEGAFTPFWDSVDEVIGALRSFDDSISGIRKSSVYYNRLLEGREHNFPPFPVKGDELPKLNSIFERLEAVISKAHRDFQFTQIYEQRKTTSAVLAGFKTLGQALSHLRRDIVSSIDSLEESVKSGFRRVSTDVRSLESTQNQNAEALRDLLESQHTEQLDGDKGRSERDERYQRQSGETLRAIRKNTTRE